MERTPRLTATLAFLALIPVGVYWLWSGHLGAVSGAIAVFNIALIASMLIVLFGSNSVSGEHGSSH